jgi:hypothetical protein
MVARLQHKTMHSTHTKKTWIKAQNCILLLYLANLVSSYLTVLPKKHKKLIFFILARLASIFTFKTSYLSEEER